MRPTHTNQPITRRQAVGRTAQAAAVCLVGSEVSPLQAAPPGPRASPLAGRKLTIGIATLGFDRLTNAALAQELAGAGCHTIQLFLSQTDSTFWRYNGRADVSSLTRERAQAIAQTYRGAGLNIHSLGVYTNLIHPDAAERAANLAYFEAMMEVGRNMGVNVFITEAGHHHDPKAPEPAVPLHFQDAAWPQMVATIRDLAARAEKHDAKVLLEPFHRGFLASAKRVRLLLEEINSPRIRALLDPANLIEVNDLEEMFQQLGPWTDCLHAKDRKLHTDRGVAAGQGDLDYGKFVRLAAQHAPHAPLIIEYVGPKDYQAALAHLRNALRQADLEEKTNS
jgi:sugar phosphate isomerase/epimerase